MSAFYKECKGIVITSVLLFASIIIVAAQDNNKKVVLITGTATGIGKATAELLIDEGYIVYGGDIQIDKNQYLAGIGGHPLKMDISRDDEVIAGIEQIIKEQGRIDVLFANAGYNQYGPIECTEIADVQRQFDVNVFGHARCVKAVLPFMRRQGGGNIIINSSLGGKISVPGMSWYTSSKHALEAFADALRMEVRKFNIRVSVIESGAVRTDIQKNAAYTLEKAKKSPYAGFYELEAFEGKFVKRSSHGVDPAAIANIILRIIKSKYPERRYLTTLDAKVAYTLHSMFGYGLTDDFLLKMFFGTQSENPLRRKSVTISINPSSLLNKEYNADIFYNTGRLRFGLSYFDVTEKSPSAETASFKQHQQGFGTGVGVFVSDEQRGLNLGLEFNFIEVSVIELATSDILGKELYHLGLQAGYLWQPFKKSGFFIEPSVHAGFSIGDRELNYSSGNIVGKENFYFTRPRLNVGWKISF
jgi:NAD(P)-dependent dehydrogenase (short-subunit alcohol dehydrogenase family)